ncbi:MAG: hypothetical protein KJ578_06065 [Bacteroidetes bacterium]|nr:hypothetical protein [Bacteroidota bacterium]MBU1577861.1 hypothetical protein [Bacteroidota bacterium]MBU2557327.1 hypothetical protein [Bacteroidota bacterium]
MIRFFRSSFAAQYLVVVLLAFLLWLPAFLQQLSPLQIDNGRQPLYDLIVSNLNDFPYVALSVALLLLLFQAFFFNAILAANNFIQRVGSSGAFVYVLLFSYTAEYTNTHAFLYAAVFILATLHTLFLIVETDRPHFYLFNTGFFVATAALFYPPAALLILWIFISMIIGLQASIRNFLTVILGFLTPVYFLVSWYFLTDQLATNFALYKGVWIQWLPDFNQISIFQWAIGINIILLLLFATRPVFGTKTEKNLRLRKKISMVNALLVFSLPMLFFQTGSIINNTALLLPIAVYLSFDFAYAQRLRWRSLLLGLLVLLIVVNQYSKLFF